jgi:hypothetical protein
MIVVGAIVPIVAAAAAAAAAARGGSGTLFALLQWSDLSNTETVPETD